MDKSAAGGVSQWTTPLLLILMDNPSCAKMITSIITRLKNGNIPARAAPYFRTSRLVTPYKPKGGIRPIGMTDILLRVTCKILTNNLPPGFKVFAEGIQFAIRIPGGSQTAAHRIQAELVRRRLGSGAARIFMFTVDFLNAFNERDRSAMAKILFSDPVYRSIFRVFNFSYSSSSTMLTFFVEFSISRNVTKSRLSTGATGPKSNVLLIFLDVYVINKVPRRYHQRDRRKSPDWSRSAPLNSFH